MNTKQKLTLGIAAIFMVTLTIVGVTYAYFVTQVTGENGEQSVNVQTATFGDLSYVSHGDTQITLDNVHPGDPSKTLLFEVQNAGLTEQSFQLTLEVENDDADHLAPNFIHSLTTSTGTRNADCYKYDATLDTGAVAGVAMPEACFSGYYFDNIEVIVYESDASRTKGTPVYGTTTTWKKLKNDPDYSITESIKINAADGKGTDVTTDDVPASMYYLVEVKYVEADLNQNYETNASLTIVPNITNTTRTIENIASQD